MTRLEKLYEEYERDYELFQAGCDTVEEKGLWNKEADGEMEVYFENDLISIVLRLIAVDGEITDKEAEYFNRCFWYNCSTEELKEIYANCKENVGRTFDEQFLQGVQHLSTIDKDLAEAYRRIIVLVCDIIVESDGVVNEKEMGEIKHLRELCAVN